MQEAEAQHHLGCGGGRPVLSSVTAAIWGQLKRSELEHIAFLVLHEACTVEP